MKDLSKVIFDIRIIIGILVGYLVTSGIGLQFPGSCFWFITLGFIISFSVVYFYWKKFNNDFTDIE